MSFDVLPCAPLDDTGDGGLSHPKAPRNLVLRFAVTNTAANFSNPPFI